MGYVSLIIVAAFLVYIITVMLGIGKQSIEAIFAIAVVVATAAGICTSIKNSRKQKAIRNFYNIQLNNSPTAQDFYDEALLIIKEKYPNPEQQIIQDCATLLDIPIIDGKSAFNKYYKVLYDDIEGIAILYAQKKSWLTGEFRNYCDDEIVKKYNHLSDNDETMLTRFPWLVSLGFLYCF